MSNNYIYMNTNSLKEKICKQIIEGFEKEDEKKTRIPDCFIIYIRED